MGKFCIRTVHTGFKFDLVAANGEAVLTSEVYSSPAACLRGIQSVQKNALTAPVADLTAQDQPSVPNPRFELYRDRGGRFRFRLRSRNGKTIAVSGTYVTRSGCREGIDSVRTNALDAELESE